MQTFMPENAIATRELSMKSQPTAVVLDPNPENRAEVQRTLTLAGVRVAGAAGHGVEGHTLVGEVQPDCVLLAIEAPLERGLQTLEAVVRSHPAMPVLVYASSADVNAVRQVMIAGAADYLVAPLGSKGLAESIG